jgi:hypothetical protein
MSKRFIVSLWASPRHVLSRLRGRCAELLRRGSTLPGRDERERRGRLTRALCVLPERRYRRQGLR